MKFKLVEIKNGDNVRYIVQYKLGFFSGWRYVETYAHIPSSDYGIDCIDDLSGEPTVIEALEAIINHFRDNQNGEVEAIKTLNQWNSFEAMEVHLRSLLSEPPGDE